MRTFLLGLITAAAVLLAAPAASPSAPPIYVVDRLPVLPLAADAATFGCCDLRTGQWPRMVVDYSKIARVKEEAFHTAGAVVDIGSWPVWHPGDTRSRPVVLFWTPQLCSGQVLPGLSGDTWPPGSWGSFVNAINCKDYAISFIPLSPGVRDVAVKVGDATVTLRGEATDRPSVEVAVDAAGRTSPTVEGRVSAEGLATAAHFEYGPTTAYGRRTPDAAVAAGFVPQTLLQSLAGLSPGVTYHVRLVAANSEGTAASEDLTFTTTSRPALTVRLSGSGKGSVTSTPAGIACGTRCTVSLAGGTHVELVAAPRRGSAFAGWQGGCHGAYTTCPLTLAAPASVTAVFRKS